MGDTRLEYAFTLKQEVVYTVWVKAHSAREAKDMVRHYHGEYSDAESVTIKSVVPAKTGYLIEPQSEPKTAHPKQVSGALPDKS